MILDERHTGEEGVIRSDIAEMIDRAAAMAVYALGATKRAAEQHRTPLPEGFSERIAEMTYADVLRYSLDDCACQTDPNSQG